MKYPPHIIEQLKARVNIVDEVRRALPNLKKKGKYWWANCPFHAEKSASFHVREEGNYYCFGCGAAGDVISFVQETQGGTFSEVVQKLAKQVGLKLPEPERHDPVAEAARTDGARALERAVAFYQRCLPHSTGAAYFAKRGLSAATLDEFQLGYAPEGWTEMHNALASEGFKPETLRHAGLTQEGKTGKGDYDRFRNRVMFPIHDGQGKVVGFGGRILDQGEPKYLNSPENPFFNKSFLLYNLHRAKPELKKTGGQLVLVEGYMDVIALWQSGFKTAVAPLGTSVTEDQLSLLWRYDDKPIVCLDGDAAGKAAALRVAEKILPILEPGKTLQFMWLPQGEDPDSLIQKDGVGAFRQLLAQPTALEQVLWLFIAQDADLTTADGRAAAEAEMGGILAKIRNAIVRKSYQQVLKDKMYQATRHASGRTPKDPKHLVIKEEKAPLDYRPAVQGDANARYLLALVCRWPELLPQVDEALAKVEFPNGQLADLAHHLHRAHAVQRQNPENIGQDLQSGPHAMMVADLLRSTGVAALNADITNPMVEFQRAYGEWSMALQHKAMLTEARRTTAWLDPEQWQKFKDMLRKPDERETGKNL